MKKKPRSGLLYLRISLFCVCFGCFLAGRNSGKCRRQQQRQRQRRRAVRSGAVRSGAEGSCPARPGPAQPSPARPGPAQPSPAAAAAPRRSPSTLWRGDSFAQI